MVTHKQIHNFSIHVKGSRACVIVIHEVWGLNSFIKGVCKRLSKTGLSSIAPDLYHRNNDLFTLTNIHSAVNALWDLPLKERYDRKNVARILARRYVSEDITELTKILYSERFRQEVLSDLISCAEYATSRYDKVSAIGFSMGGRLSLRLASQYQKLKSCVSFCGEPPRRQELERITVPILTIHAGKDDFINTDVPKFVGEALELKKSLTLRIYPRAKHEFFDETNKQGYSVKEARDSWKLTLDFLKVTLS